MEEKKVNIAAIGAQYGAIAGLSCLVLTLGLYLINIELVLSFWIFVGYAIIVGFKVVTAVIIKNAMHNFIKFKDVLKGTFMVSVIALLIWNVFNAVLFAYIDPQLIELSKEQEIKRSSKFLELSGAPEDAIDEMIVKVEQKDFSPSVRTTAENYARTCIVGFIYSLGIAGIFHLTGKNNSPPSQIDPSIT